MKKITFLILTFLLTSLSSFSAVNLNLTGKWFGTRYQFDESKSKYVSEFQYTYDLVQEGKNVKGVSRIISQSGKTAEIAVRGFVENNLFYFEEYEIIQATRDENMIWCLKKGVLNIKKDGSDINISGKTPSYMEFYGLECTGGFTFLSKEKSVPNDETVSTLTKENAVENSYQINTYPNPFVSDINVSFSLNSKSNVAVDFVDISGKIVKSIENKEYEVGQHTVTFTPDASLDVSYFIVRLKIGENTYTRTIQKFNNK